MERKSMEDHARAECGRRSWYAGAVSLCSLEKAMLLSTSAKHGCDLAVQDLQAARAHTRDQVDKLVSSSFMVPGWEAGCHGCHPYITRVSE